MQEKSPGRMNLAFVPVIFLCYPLYKNYATIYAHIYHNQNNGGSMYKKYFAWSFDDGLEQDKRIIKILKRYGMGATFHLNSGLLGEKNYIGRIGNLGMHEVSSEEYEAKKHHLLPSVPHFRIPEDELKEVYAGFEIASHTISHVNLARCSEEERLHQIKDDAADLSELFGQEVTGFAFPYGAGAKESRNALEQAGIRYARLVMSSPTFRFPDDPLAMPMTCWHISPKALQLIDQFIQKEPEEDDLFFLMFAHGYEFDFGTKESSWTKFDQICRTVSAQKDIICCSIGDAFRHHENKE